MTGKELTDQVPVGTMDLNAVKARGNRTPGTFNKPGDNMVDVKQAHLFRYRIGFSVKGFACTGAIGLGAMERCAGFTSGQAMRPQWKN